MATFLLTKVEKTLANPTLLLQLSPETKSTSKEKSGLLNCKTSITEQRKLFLIWCERAHFSFTREYFSQFIRNQRKPGIPMPTLLEAAEIAAYFSKSGKSSHVPVDYTWAKFVVKPKGSKPGFVTYTREKTLYVEPQKPGKHR